MKKLLILALIILAAFTVMLFRPKRSAGTRYPLNTVRTVVSDSARAFGGRVMEERRESGLLRGPDRFGRVGRWLRGLAGNNDPEGKDHAVIHIGSNNFTITSFHQHGNVLQLQIEPDPSASTQFADLKRAIHKKLPCIDFAP